MKSVADTAAASYENAAGNTGFDEIAVTLEKRVIPGSVAGGGATVAVNIAFDADPSIDTRDELRYYYGEDDENAVTLTEALPVIRWGTQGSGPGQFNHPMSVAVLGDAVFVLDNGNARVQKFTKTGSFCSSAPIESTGSFCGICASGGFIYAADDGTYEPPPGTSVPGAIFKIDPNAMAVVERYADDLLSHPWNIAADPSGNIYAVVPAQTRIVKRDAATGAWAVWKDDFAISAWAMAIPADGIAYVIELYELGGGQYGRKISRFDLDAEEIPWTVGSDILAVTNAWAVAVDVSGRIYVCDPQAQKVFRFSADGALQAECDTALESAGFAAWGLGVSDGSAIYGAEYSSHRVFAIRNSLTFVSDENNLFFGSHMDVSLTAFGVEDINNPGTFIWTPTDDDLFAFDPDVRNAVRAVVRPSDFFDRTLFLECIETSVDSRLFQGTLDAEVGFGDTVVENIYVPNDFTGQLDSIQHFYGLRDVEETDAVLSEAPDEGESQVFRGLIEGAPSVITITDFDGLSAEIDTLEATVQILSGERTFLFQETAAQSKLFRMQYSARDDGDPHRLVSWSARAQRVARRTLFFSKPFNIRVKGLPEAELCEVVLLDGITSDLEHGPDGHCYLKGGSLKNLRVENSGDGTVVKGGPGEEAATGDDGGIDGVLRKKDAPNLPMANKTEKARKIKFYYNNETWDAENEIDSEPSRLFLLEQFLGIEVEATAGSQVQVQTYISGHDQSILLLHLAEVQGMPGLYRNAEAGGPSLGPEFDAQRKILRVDHEGILILKAIVNGQPQPALTMAIGVDLAEVAVVEGYTKSHEESDLERIYTGLLDRKWHGLGVWKGIDAKASRARDLFRKVDLLMVGGHGQEGAVRFSAAGKARDELYLRARELDPAASQCRWILIAACSEVRIQDPQEDPVDLSTVRPYKWLTANPNLHAVMGYMFGAAWYEDNDPAMQAPKLAGQRFADALHQGKTVTEAWMEANRSVANDFEEYSQWQFSVVNASAFTFQDNDRDQVGMPDTFPTPRAMNRTSFLYSCIRFIDDAWIVMTHNVHHAKEEE